MRMAVLLTNASCVVGGCTDSVVTTLWERMFALLMNDACSPHVACVALKVMGKLLCRRMRDTPKSTNATFGDEGPIVMSLATNTLRAMRRHEACVFCQSGGCAVLDIVLTSTRGGITLLNNLGASDTIESAVRCMYRHQWGYHETTGQKHLWMLSDTFSTNTKRRDLLEGNFWTLSASTRHVFGTYVSRC